MILTGNFAESILWGWQVGGGSEVEQVVEEWGIEGACQGEVHYPHPGAAASPKCLKMSHKSSMRQSQSGIGTQTANQPKLIPPILSPGQPRP